METERTSQLLAIAAAVLLVINIGVLVQVTVGDDLDVPAVDGVAGSVQGDDTPGGADASDVAEADQAGGGGATGVDGPGDAATDGAGTEGAGTGGAGSGSQPVDGGTASEGTGAGGGGAAVLTSPEAGAYTYASAGTWGFSTDQERQLPATATATVAVGEDGWVVRMDAGQMYADEFSYSLGADGLDWTSWSLLRFEKDRVATTTYRCEGDAPFHVADHERGRTSRFTCSQGDITSTGTVTSQGLDDVTLQDGTTVPAVHLVYEYEVEGGGDLDATTTYEVTGGGRLDLWLDPGTGMRIREQRTISTLTSVSDGREITYDEDVDLTLVSLTPDDG